MEIHSHVPFYPNTADNVHCCQASMKMVQEYFQPTLKMSFEEWDVITAHKKDLWTWTMAGLIWFKKQGFDVIHIETFDYEEFSTRGPAYLLEFAGKEVGEAQIRYSDIPQEMEIAKQFITTIQLEKRLPSFDDIQKLLDQGYLIICNVNAHALYNEEGYSGHLVVVKGYNKKELILNDPGLPGKENAHVAYDDFYKAWAYPDQDALNLSALRIVK